jgi:hypothetical protein
LVKEVRRLHTPARERSPSDADRDRHQPRPRFATSDCPAPTFTFATLRAVLAELEPLHGQRAIRAANIVACRAIEPSYSPGGWYVQSESDPDTDYIVLNVGGLDVWSCTCKDWALRSPAACKHILAITILQECEARERGPEPQPLALPFTEDDPDVPITYVLTDAALKALAAAPAA